jgi:hypothetical protein
MVRSTAGCPLSVEPRKKRIVLLGAVLAIGWICLVKAINVG